MAGWNNSVSFSPGSAALIGSLIATYFTFLPSFLFIMLGGPYLEKFRGNKKLSAALSTVTAAVVGVVLNLAVWFGIQVLVPTPGRINGFGMVLGLASFAALQWGKIGMIPLILASGAAGVLFHFLLG